LLSSFPKSRRFARKLQACAPAAAANSPIFEALSPMLAASYPAIAPLASTVAKSASAVQASFSNVATSTAVVEATASIPAAGTSTVQAGSPKAGQTAKLSKTGQKTENLKVPRCFRWNGSSIGAMIGRYL